MTPSDENECRQMLYTGYQHEGPAAVRYPRGSGAGVEAEQTMTALPLGKGRVLRESAAVAGKRVALLAFGAPLSTALAIAAQLDATVADMRFVKPLDDTLVASLAASHDLLVTLEENATAGGAGSAVLESLANAGLSVPVLLSGLPDRYIEHASPGRQWLDAGLDSVSMLDRVRQRLARC